MSIAIRAMLVYLAVGVGLLGCEACGSQSEQEKATVYTGALGELDNNQLAEYNRKLDELGETAGVPLLRPRYLPRGTSWQPEIGTGLNEAEARMTFYRDSFDAPAPESPVIRILQSRDPDRRMCPPCSYLNESDLQEWEAHGTRLFVDVRDTGVGRVFASIYFRVSELRVNAHFDWGPAAEISGTITDAMKTEALKVVGSMLEEGS